MILTLIKQWSYSFKFEFLLSVGSPDGNHEVFPFELEETFDTLFVLEHFEFK